MTPHYPDLAGRHAVVTGGANGIGAAIVAALHRQSARVTLLDIVAPTSPDTQLPGVPQPSYIECDLRKSTDIERSIESASAIGGPIDVLVNNAARDDRHTLEQADAALWDELSAVNLRAAFLSARAAARTMTTVQGGSIINISSNSFLLGLEGYPIYATAKAGLWGMTKALARELGGHGIRVNCLVPGWVMTERQKNRWVTPEALAACMAAQCLKTEILPLDIANACLFLASSASRMMSSQMLVIDGGRA